MAFFFFFFSSPDCPLGACVGGSLSSSTGSPLSWRRDRTRGGITRNQICPICPTDNQRWPQPRPTDRPTDPTDRPMADKQTKQARRTVGKLSQNVAQRMQTLHTEQWLIRIFFCRYVGWPLPSLTWRCEGGGAGEKGRKGPHPVCLL